MRKYNTKKTNSWDKVKTKPKDIPKETFIEICNNSESMAHACSKIGLNFTTFVKYAKKYECYKPNQSGKGVQKRFNARKFSIELWKSDKCIVISRASLKKWIIKLDLLPQKCNKCGLDEWLGQKISLELNHINGKGFDNRRSNLELICPNCHAQTPTYRGKNKYPGDGMQTTSP